MHVLCRGVLVLCAALLVAAARTTTTTTTTTTPSPRESSHVFGWKWNNFWTTPANWGNEVCPVYGDTVSFPAYVSEFGMTDCLSLEDPDCVLGGIISLSGDQTAETPYFDAQAGSLLLPSNGILSFDTDGEISFQQGVVTQNNLWLDRGAESRDFKCAYNWVLLDEDSTNSDFISPCFADSIDLSNAYSVTFNVPRYSFVQSVADPNHVTTNVRMVTGSEFRTDPQCPQPFGPDAGYQYCVADCMNTCPQLHPNKKAGVLQNVEQIAVLQEFVDMAMDSVNAQLEGLNTPVTATGSVTFLAADDIQQDVLSIVAARAQTDLEMYWDVESTFTCTIAAGGIWGVDCTVTSQIPTAKVGAYCLSVSGEWMFREGLLNAVFDSLVTLYFTQANNEYLLMLGEKQSATPFVSAQFDVPQRFMTDLGTPLPTGDIAVSLAERLSVKPVDISGIQFYNSTKAGQVGFSFAVFTNSTNFTTSYIQTTILAASSKIPIFSVALSSGLTVVLYNPVAKETASAAKLSVVEVVMQNTAIYSALPMSSDVSEAFILAVKAFLQSKNVNGVSDIMELDCYKDPSTLYARRRGTTPQVVIAFTVPASSSLLVNSGLNNLFGQFTYDGVTSTPVGTSPKYLSVDSLARDMTNSSLAQYASNINAAVAAIGILQDEILSTGGSPATSATGSYGWSDLDTIVASINNPQITNADCAVIAAKFANNETGLNALFQQAVAVMLPISAEAITVSGSIQCIPLNPLQTNYDQDAVFSVSLTISAPFIYFASDANYVTYDTEVDHTLQFLEDTAPLNLANVRDALTRALHSIIISSYNTELYKEMYDELASIGITTTTAPEITTAAPPGTEASTAGAGLPLGIVAGAAGGFIVIIIIIVIVVVVSRRGKSAPRKSERTVVAFENPMYDNQAGVSASNAGATYDQGAEAQGLYDEPAFKTSQEKENPVYESTENLADNIHQDASLPEQDGGYLDVNAE